MIQSVSNFAEDQFSVSVESETDVESGISPDMGIWSEDRYDQFDKLLLPTYDENKSSYNFAEATVNVSGFTPVKDGELEVSEQQTEPEVGSSETMEIWYGSRDEKIKALVNPNYINASSYPIPKGVVDVSGFSSYSDGEISNGIGISGDAIAPNGLPLEATVTLTADGERVGSSQILGSYTSSFEPPDRVTTGDSVFGMPEYTAVLNPTADGVGYEVDGISMGGADGVGAVYGWVEGEVTDSKDMPVPNDVISGPAFSTTTNSEGQYRFMAPGSSLDLSVINDTYELPITASSSETVREDIQYPGIEINVQDENGRPVANAPVIYDGERMTTDGAGVVEITKATIGEHSISILGEFTDTINVSSPGGLMLVNETVGGFVEVRCENSTTGDPISGVVVESQNTGFHSDTDGSGRAPLFHTSSLGDLVVTVADGDMRYKTEVLQVDRRDIGSHVNVELESADLGVNF